MFVSTDQRCTRTLAEKHLIAVGNGSRWLITGPSAKNKWWECSSLNGTLTPLYLRYREHYRRWGRENAKARIGRCFAKSYFPDMARTSHLWTHFSCSYLQKTRIRLHQHFIMARGGFMSPQLFCEVLLVVNSCWGKWDAHVLPWYSHLYLVHALGHTQKRRQENSGKIWLKKGFR